MLHRNISYNPAKQSRSLYVSLALSLAIFLSVSIPLLLSLYLPHSLSLSLSLYVSLSLSSCIHISTISVQTKLVIGSSILLQAQVVRVSLRLLTARLHNMRRSALLNSCLIWFTFSFGLSVNCKRLQVFSCIKNCLLAFHNNYVPVFSLARLISF